MDHSAHSPETGDLPQVDPAELMSHPHAFVMVGQESLFACHMTSLWMLGHTYEIVLRLHVPYDVMRTYVEATRTVPTAGEVERLFSPSTIFLTCFPDPFPLPELLLGRRQFVGQMNRGFPRHFTGWPWSAEKPLKHRFPVEIERVVHFRHFDYSMEYPHRQRYLLFGERSEAHLYHSQTKELDYDHVASLASAPDWLHPKRLRTGVFISVVDLPGGRTPCEDPFGARKAWGVQYQGTGPVRPLTVARSQWFFTAVTNRPGSPPCSDGAASSSPASPAMPPHAHHH
jgi:hypothetical protein